MCFFNPAINCSVITPLTVNAFSLMDFENHIEPTQHFGWHRITAAFLHLQRPSWNTSTTGGGSISPPLNRFFIVVLICLLSSAIPSTPSSASKVPSKVRWERSSLCRPVVNKQWWKKRQESNLLLKGSPSRCDIGKRTAAATTISTCFIAMILSSNAVEQSECPSQLSPAVERQQAKRLSNYTVGMGWCGVHPSTVFYYHPKEARLSTPWLDSPCNCS